VCECDQTRPDQHCHGSQNTPLYKSCKLHHRIHWGLWLSRNHQLRRLPLSLLSSAGQWTVRQWRRGGDAPIGKPRHPHELRGCPRAEAPNYWSIARFAFLSRGPEKPHAKAVPRHFTEWTWTRFGKRKTKPPGSARQKVSCISRYGKMKGICLFMHKFSLLLLSIYSFFYKKDNRTKFQSSISGHSFVLNPNIFKIVLHRV